MASFFSQFNRPARKSLKHNKVVMDFFTSILFLNFEAI